MSEFIVIGSGPGGSAAALRILQSGHRVLLLERGDFLPKEADNRSTTAVYGDRKYRTSERWREDDGDPASEPFQPWMHYHVGGNAKLYGAALYRFRPGDFGQTEYPDGISPAWPIDYSQFAPYYDAAETLYEVAGDRSQDPTEPTELPFPNEALEDEAFIAELKRDLPVATHSLALGVAEGPPTGWNPDLSKFDAYPDPSLGKSDPESRVLESLIAFGDRFALRTGAMVDRLKVNANGDVEAVILDSGEELKADCYVLAAGAINSARIVLQSGLGERSHLIGANYMAHLSTTLISRFSKEVNLSFAKTFGSNEWYQPDAAGPVMLGSIQTQGKWDSTQYGLEPWTSELGDAETMAARGVEFFMMSEDLPRPENRINLKGGEISITRKLTNVDTHRALLEKFEGSLAATPHFEASVSNLMPLAWCTHQCGTLVFGENPSASVLDLHCRFHGSENLYVTDSSFFPSSTALNPTLTVVANALRVGEHLGRL